MPTPPRRADRRSRGARGVVNERRLIRIAVVEHDGGSAAFESKVSVQTGGELGQTGRLIEVELPCQHTIGGDAQHREEQRESPRAEECEPAAKGERHGGLSVSM